MRQRKKFLLVAGGCALLILACLPWPGGQPRADGHTLDYWVEVLGPVYVVPTDAHRREQAREAIAKMGTNAIPRLLKWIDYDFVVSKRQRIRSAATAYLPPIIARPVVKFLAPVREIILANTAPQGFGALGIAGIAAIPELEARVRISGSQHQERSIKALIAIGLPAVPALLNLITNADPQTGAFTIKQMRPLGTNAMPAIPPLGALVRIPGPYHQERSINALIAIGPPAVPALLNLITNADPQISAFTIKQMRSLGTNAVPAIPTLIACLDDTRYTVAVVAAETLGGLGLQPEAVVPALISARTSRPGLRPVATTALYRFVQAKDKTAIDLLSKEADKPEPDSELVRLLAE